MLNFAEVVMTSLNIPDSDLIWLSVDGASAQVTRGKEAATLKAG